MHRKFSFLVKERAQTEDIREIGFGENIYNIT